MCFKHRAHPFFTLHNSKLFLCYWFCFSWLLDEKSAATKKKCNSFSLPVHVCISYQIQLIVVVNRTVGNWMKKRLAIKARSLESSLGIAKYFLNFQLIQMGPLPTTTIYIPGWEHSKRFTKHFQFITFTVYNNSRNSITRESFRVLLLLWGGIGVRVERSKSTWASFVVLHILCTGKIPNKHFRENFIHLIWISRKKNFKLLFM